MSTRTYYDEFSRGYDRARGRRYHRLLDELELRAIAPLTAGRDALDLACGTGLILMALHERARSAVGLDLSGGMLQIAARRGLRVVQGAAHHLPFPDASFDLVTCFKAFPHFDARKQSLAEIDRVLRPGGWAALELYNPHSLRGLLRRLGPARATSATYHEGEVSTQFDTPRTLARDLPPGLVVERARGIRVVIPAGELLDVPVAGAWLAAAERRLSALSVARHIAGFVVVLLRKV